jgi:hypothetical protein
LGTGEAANDNAGGGGRRSRPAGSAEPEPASLAEQIAEQQTEFQEHAEAAGDVEADLLESGLSERPQFEPAGPAADVVSTQTPGALNDPAFQALLEHVENAKLTFAEEGFTPAQTEAIERAATPAERDRLRAMYYGDRIDGLVKASVNNDARLNHLGISERFQPGPDFFDPATDTWYDLTTARSWPDHVASYGDYVPQGR